MYSFILHYSYKLHLANVEMNLSCKYRGATQGRPRATGEFCPGLHGQPERGPMKGPLNTCLKDRYTLIEQSDLDTLIEQSEYFSEEQCSKLINKEIWLVRASYCHCQHVMTFFFWSLTYILGEVVIQNGKPPCPCGPTLTLCPGPHNLSGRLWCYMLYFLQCKPCSLTALIPMSNQQGI